MTQLVNKTQSALEQAKFKIREIHHAMNTKLVRAERKLSETPSSDIRLEVAALRGQLIGLTQGLSAISEVEESQDEFKLFGGGGA